MYLLPANPALRVDFDVNLNLFLGCILLKRRKKNLCALIRDNDNWDTWTNVSEKRKITSRVMFHIPKEFVKVFRHYLRSSHVTLMQIERRVIFFLLEVWNNSFIKWRKNQFHHILCRIFFYTYFIVFVSLCKFV